MSDVDYSAPFDASDFILREQKSAKITALNSLDDDPEKAVRAQQLSEATGAHPAVVYGDLDNFDAQHKAALTADLLSNNQFLQSYVNSHPLAAKISNDDYGQLDAVSQAMGRLSGGPSMGDDILPPGTRSVLGAIVKGFNDNLNIQQFDVEHRKLAELMASSPVFGNIFIRQAALAGIEVVPAVAALFGAGISGLAAGFGEAYKQAGGNEAEANRLTRDLIILAQVGLAGQAKSGAGMFTRPIGPEPKQELQPGVLSKAEGPKGVGSVRSTMENAASTYGEFPPEVIKSWEPEVLKNYLIGKVNQTAAEVHKATEPYIAAGKEPPVGVHPIVDEMKAEQAKTDAVNLTEALKESVKSATRERSPDLFTSFIAQHTDGEIGINADAVRKLYGHDPAIDGQIAELTARLEKVKNFNRRYDNSRDYGPAAEAGESTGQYNARIQQHPAYKKASAERAADLAEESHLAEQIEQLESQRVKKVPVPGEGPLGFIPDLAAQLERAEATGGDISVDVAKYLGHVDPEVHKELADHIRARPEGVTVEEGKNLPTDYLEVYHGSPYQFEAFDTQHIGSGEGAQAYGYGHYLAENPKVAEGYKNNLTKVAQAIRGEIPGSELPEGSLYKAKINRHPDEFLDWDKKFAEQTPQVQEALRPLLEESLAKQQEAKNSLLARGVDAFGRPFKGKRLADLETPVSKIEDLTGEQIHKRLGAKDEQGKQAKDQHEGAKNSARWLSDSGVAGIKYLDQGSRGAGEGSRNYVVFNDKDVEITHRNNEAVQTIRQAAGLQGQVAERKLNLKEFDTFTTRDGEVKHAFTMHDAEGREVGNLHIVEEKGGKQLYIDSVEAPEGPQSLGTSAMREILQQIKEQFPNAETLKGARVTGAREKAEADQGISRSAKDLEATIDLTKIKPRAKAPEAGAPGLLQRAKEAIVGKSEEAKAAEAKAVEERELFDKASAIGMTVDQYKRYAKLINERAAEDAEATSKRALADQAKRQTAEWKANRAELRPQVREEVLARPDVELDEMLREGKVKLAADALTPDQRALLPKDFVAADGIHPEDLANLFGDQNAAALVDRVIALGQGREAAGMKPKPHLERLVDAETDRQMEAKYGSLDKNILDEAKDQVLSETQESLLHEEVLARAEEAGMQLTITKEELKAAIKDFFDRSAVKDVSSDKGLAEAGRAGRAAEMALLKGDYAEAFRQKQRQFNAFTMATYAKKFEKVVAQFEKSAKRFSSREVPGVSPEYTNWVHDILGRVGSPVKRSVQDLLDAIGREEHKTLEDFVDHKQIHDMRELPVAEFLMDPNFAKNAKELTTAEFSAMNDSIKALAKNGRDETKIIKAGEEYDLDQTKAEMINQLKEFKEKHYDASGGRWLGPLPPSVAKPLRTYLVSHLQLESVFNRWDRGDPNGVFTQFIARELATAANSEAALERQFSIRLREIADKVNLKEKVENNLFRDPLGGELIQMNRGNLRAVLMDAGNDSNFTKRAKGYLGSISKGEAGKAEVDAFKAQIMDWLHKTATKEDWDWAQKLGDIFADIKKQSDVMYRSLTGGVEPENIPLRPIDTPHGQYKGWYYPVIYHPVWEGASKKLMGGDPLEQVNYNRATTPAGYTKSRTGYAAPMTMDIDMMPVRMRQMLHDIAFRPSVIQAGKIFYDKDVRAAITKHYGEEYTKSLVPYLRDVANAANYRNDASAVFTRFSETVRQNVIATLIGLNPGTVLKHGPTALINSITEVGAKDFLRAAQGLFSINDATGESNWAFAMKTSEELSRRHRFYRETLGGAQQEVMGTPSLRDQIVSYGSMPVAMSDLLSAVPTWMAKYEASMREHGVHGDAVFEADRAVRRAHGSSVVTNRPQIMRTGPLGSWLASLYGFFNHIMNRQYELAWKAGDTLGMVKDGEYAKAMKEVPGITGMIFSYVLFPALVEELVTPLTNDKHESWGKMAAKSIGFSLASSWIGIRDIASAALNGRDPSVGLLGTAYKTVTDTVRDLNKDRPFSKANAGALLQHAATTLGAMTGLVNAQVGKAARFGLDVANRQEHPKGPWGWMVGLRYGTLKNHSQTFEQWRKGH